MTQSSPVPSSAALTSPVWLLHLKTGLRLESSPGAPATQHMGPPQVLLKSYVGRGPAGESVKVPRF